MKLVVGLGNPGMRYRWTRHNLGFWVIDRLGKKNRIAVKSPKFDSLVGEGTIGAEMVVLAKPLIYMNLSGEAVSALLEGYRVSPQDLIICCDDVALPLGRIRIRQRGGHGGHKGLRSIIELLGTEEFPRLRIGIARAEEESLVDYVLSGFRGKEKAIVDEAIACASEAVEFILTRGIVAAMNRYNPRGE